MELKEKTARTIITIVMTIIGLIIVLSVIGSLIFTIYLIKWSLEGGIWWSNKEKIMNKQLIGKYPLIGIKDIEEE